MDIFQNTDAVFRKTTIQFIDNEKNCFVFRKLRQRITHAVQRLFQSKYIIEGKGSFLSLLDMFIKIIYNVDWIKAKSILKQCTNIFRSSFFNCVKNTICNIGRFQIKSLNNRRQHRDNRFCVKIVLPAVIADNKITGFFGSIFAISL